LNDLIRSVPHPLGPRAELQQIAKLFHLSVNFTRLPKPTTHPHSPGYTQPVVLHRVALHFAGRQYVSESTARSTAEQEAACAALKALRRALLFVTGKSVDESHTEYQNPIFRLDSAVWRLRVIGHLHGERPIFVIQWRLACDRAELRYGQEINPIQRLHFVCVAKQLPAPVFELLSTIPESTSRPSPVPATRPPPEFTYRVRLSTGCIQGPPAYNKRLAKRLAAEATLSHLGFQIPEPVELPSALHSPRAQDPVFDSSSIVSNGSPSSEVTDPPSNNTGQGSLKERHVAFSCTRDVLIIEENGVVPWKRTHRSTRVTGSIGHLGPCPKAVSSDSLDIGPQQIAVSTHRPAALRVRFWVVKGSDCAFSKESRLITLAWST
uniref:DRBM domain-containing protein n=1 Tax=Echinostoma caproni TaxID=27848 RepID=A0A183AS52_9TREM